MMCKYRYTLCVVVFKISVVVFLNIHKEIMFFLLNDDKNISKRGYIKFVNLCRKAHPRIVELIRISPNSRVNTHIPE